MSEARRPEATAVTTRPRVLRSIRECGAEAWNAVVGELPLPFLRWEWLDALESSGSASARTGWEPHHLTLWRGEELVALAPAYRKHHSMGEYVYDFSWAHAAEAMGVRYYPKLLVGVPLCPITAPRFLAAPGEDLGQARRALVSLALESARAGRCSSVHVIFPPEDEVEDLEALGMSRRTGLQYHWHNAGYGTYDDFLARFDSKRRHQLRRERGAAQKQGIVLRTLRGAELTPAHADLAHRFYATTCSKNAWGQVQLNRDFFRRAFASSASALEMVLAERGGEVVAGAFNINGGGRLFGRYWGCFEEHPFLHFNVCLYQSIDDCIRLGRQVFEPGAGGEHKIARGFQPSAIHSAHVIFDPRLDAAVRDFVERERAQLARILAEAEQLAGLRPRQVSGGR